MQYITNIYAVYYQGDVQYITRVMCSILPTYMQYITRVMCSILPAYMQYITRVCAVYYQYITSIYAVYYQGDGTDPPGPNCDYGRRGAPRYIAEMVQTPPTTYIYRINFTSSCLQEHILVCISYFGLRFKRKFLPPHI